MQERPLVRAERASQASSSGQMTIVGCFPYASTQTSPNRSARLPRQKQQAVAHAETSSSAPSTPLKNTCLPTYLPRCPVIAPSYSAPDLPQYLQLVPKAWLPTTTQNIRLHLPHLPQPWSDWEQGESRPERDLWLMCPKTSSTRSMTSRDSSPSTKQD
jgi:hypothetical protein